MHERVTAVRPKESSERPSAAVPMFALLMGMFAACLLLVQAVAYILLKGDWIPMIIYAVMMTLAVVVLYPMIKKIKHRL